MTLNSCTAMFMRGGASKGIVFHERDLPYEWPRATPCS